MTIIVGGQKKLKELQEIIETKNLALRVGYTYDYKDRNQDYNVDGYDAEMYYFNTSNVKKAEQKLLDTLFSKYDNVKGLTPLNKHRNSNVKSNSLKNGFVYVLVLNSIENYRTLI